MRLHAYVLLANQLDAKFLLSGRLIGLNLGNQVFAAVVGALSLALGYMKEPLNYFLGFSVSEPGDFFAFEQLKRLFGYWLYMLWALLAISIFAAAFHSWVFLLPVAMGALLGLVVIVLDVLASVPEVSWRVN